MKAFVSLLLISVGLTGCATSGGQVGNDDPSNPVGRVETLSLNFGEMGYRRTEEMSVVAPADLPVSGTASYNTIMAIGADDWRILGTGKVSVDFGSGDVGGSFDGFAGVRQEVSGGPYTEATFLDGTLVVTDGDLDRTVSEPMSIYVEGELTGGSATIGIDAELAVGFSELDSASSGAMPDAINGTSVSGSVLTLDGAIVDGSVRIEGN